MMDSEFLKMMVYHWAWMVKMYDLLILELCSCFVWSSAYRLVSHIRRPDAVPVLVSSIQSPSRLDTGILYIQQFTQFQLLSVFLIGNIIRWNVPLAQEEWENILLRPSTSLDSASVSHLARFSSQLPMCDRGYAEVCVLLTAYVCFP